jgi:3-oxoacyl-[acyl-carrier protein] reductase
MQKVAIITGASLAIGRSIAKRLAQDGFAVVMNHLSDCAKAEGLMAEIRSQGGAAIAMNANVAIQSDAERLFKQTIEMFGRVDVVVNNSEFVPFSSLYGADTELLDEAISRNLRRTVLVLEQAAQYVPDGGRIIVLSNSGLAQYLPSFSGYMTLRARIEAYLYQLAHRLHDRNVNVNAVVPGPVAAELFLKTPPNKYAVNSGDATQGLPMQSPDIPGIVSFLAGPAGRLVNSQVLQTDPGLG